MHIKARFTVLMVVFLLAVCSVGFTTLAGTAKTDTKSQNTTPPMPVYYVLTVYENRLAIFCSEKQEPLKTFDILLESLPERDQAALKDGITVSNLTEALQLLEDYE